MSISIQGELELIAKGLSAYEVAVLEGYTGTETEMAGKSQRCRRSAG